jgi:hypothetical protein
MDGFTCNSIADASRAGHNDNSVKINGYGLPVMFFLLRSKVLDRKSLMRFVFVFR